MSSAEINVIVLFLFVVNVDFIEIETGKTSGCLPVG